MSRRVSLPAARCRTRSVARTEAIAMLGHSRVTIRPVIDLEGNPSYTGYVAPPNLRDQTALLNGGQCGFPACNRPARTGEYDHMIELGSQTGGLTRLR